MAARKFGSAIDKTAVVATLAADPVQHTQLPARKTDRLMSEQNKGAPIVSAKDTTATLTGTIGAATVALVANPTVAPWQAALIAGFVALMPGVLAAASEAFVTRKRRDAQRFWDTITEQWARAEDKTPEEIAGILEARKDEPYVNETIWRSIRAVMEAADDAATVPLGVLAQEYLRNGKRPDAFFRGTVKLLQELDAREMGELGTMLRHTLETSREQLCSVVARRPDLAAPNDLYSIEITGDQRQNRLFPDVLSDPDRLFGLLEREQLARDVGDSGWVHKYFRTLLARSTAERLEAILRLI